MIPGLTVLGRAHVDDEHPLLVVAAAQAEIESNV
jgi:hypothetical protein